MGEVVVITGPIASGKSTTAAALAAVLAEAGRSVAVTDLDDVVEALRAPGEDIPTLWGRARRAHAALVVGWIEAGVDVVVVHGPFVTADEQAPLLDALPEGTVPRWALLLAPYEVALDRVADDPARLFSRDPELLLATYERFAGLGDDIPPCDWTFDTTTRPVAEVAAAIAADLCP